MGRTKANGGLEIPAHSHGEFLQPMIFGDLGQQSEMRTGWLCLRRNAHQPGQLRAENPVRLNDQSLGLAGKDTGLLGFLAGVNLDEQRRTPSYRIHRASKGRHQSRPIQRMDNLKANDSVAGLVGLQRTDQMQLEIISVAPPRLRLLNAVFTEDALSFFEDGGNLWPGLLFGYGDQRDRVRITTCLCRGGVDALQNLLTGSQGKRRCNLKR